MVDAICYLHEKGIYHRDIKPENIIVLKDTFELKIIDLGMLDLLPINWHKVGTHIYLPPELNDGGRITYGQS